MKIKTYDIMQGVSFKAQHPIGWNILVYEPHFWLKYANALFVSWTAYYYYFFYKRMNQTE